MGAGALKARTGAGAGAEATSAAGCCSCCCLRAGLSGAEGRVEEARGGAGAGAGAGGGAGAAADWARGLGLGTVATTAAGALPPASPEPVSEEEVGVKPGLPPSSRKARLARAASRRPSSEPLLEEPSLVAALLRAAAGLLVGLGAGAGVTAAA